MHAIELKITAARRREPKKGKREKKPAKKNEERMKQNSRGGKFNFNSENACKNMSEFVRE